MECMGTNVYILLCEDRDEDAHDLAEHLRHYEDEHPYTLRVTRATSTDEARSLLVARHYNLLLLDVFLGGHNGISELGQIAADSTCETIVVTSSPNHALAAFGIDAVGYVLKPAAYQEVEHALDRALSRLGQVSDTLVLIRRGRAIRLDHSRIVYCETRNHQQRIVLSDGGTELVRMSGAEMFAKLSSSSAFFRVGASYIVNLDHVRQLEGHRALMDDGSVLLVPRGSVSGLRDAYFAYWRGKALP